MFIVKGNSGTYTIKADNKGVLYCTCPAWRFSPGQGESKDCKHLKQVRATTGLPTNLTVQALIGQA